MILGIFYDLQDLRYLDWSRIRHSSGTAGSLLKAQEKVDGKNIYYKLSQFDSGRGKFGFESVNEIIVDRLLDAMGIDHLQYQLVHGMISIEDTCPLEKSNYVRGKRGTVSANYTVWVDSNSDMEIPTLTSSDKLLLYSPSYVPDEYEFLRLYDNGYSFGITSLTAEA